ncbi:MAG: hypothetical protein HQL58_00695 [Magnetococcales bacterium]|nr:hypothetical protein [Magnetococcales bacterium]
MKWIGAVAVFAGMVYPVALGAESITGGVEFSADVVRTTRDGRHEQGRIHVGRGGVRSEALLNGQKVAMIYDISQKQVWMLLLEQKFYTSRNGVDMRPPPLPDAEDSPCRQRERFSCTQQGAEQLQGRHVLRWIVLVRGTEQVVPHELWIDPRVRIAIREQYGDGLVVELRNIREEAQSPALFTVPADYRPMPVSTEGTKP